MKPRCAPPSALDEWAATAKRSVFKHAWAEEDRNPVVSFCGDCTRAYRERAQAAGRCPYPVIEFRYDTRDGTWLPVVARAETPAPEDVID